MLSSLAWNSTRHPPSCNGTTRSATSVGMPRKDTDRAIAVRGSEEAPVARVLAESGPDVRMTAPIRQVRKGSRAEKTSWAGALATGGQTRRAWGS